MSRRRPIAAAASAVSATAELELLEAQGRALQEEWTQLFERYAADIHLLHDTMEAFRREELPSFVQPRRIDEDARSYWSFGAWAAISEEIAAALASSQTIITQSASLTLRNAQEIMALEEARLYVRSRLEAIAEQLQKSRMVTIMYLDEEEVTNDLNDFCQGHYARLQEEVQQNYVPEALVTSHSLLVYGNLAGRFIDSDLVLRSFDQYLVKLLKNRGWEHIIFYGSDSNRGAYCLDPQSARFFFPEISSGVALPARHEAGQRPGMSEKAEAGEKKDAPVPQKRRSALAMYRGGYKPGMQPSQAPKEEPQEEPQAAPQRDEAPLQEVTCRLDWVLDEFVRTISPMMQRLDNRMAVVFYNVLSTDLSANPRLIDSLLRRFALLSTRRGRRISLPFSQMKKVAFRARKERLTEIMDHLGEKLADYFTRIGLTSREEAMQHLNAQSHA